MVAHVHLVVPDLFLPQQVAAEACAGLDLPALQTILARAQPTALPAESLEAWLCEAFGVQGQAIAPVTLLADGMPPGSGYWLRADPVCLQLQRDQVILQPEVALVMDEAIQMCASLNAHFADDGLRFVAPHPQRWYLSLESVPAIATSSLAEVAGQNIHAHLPQGSDALRWHGIVNEIQMLLFEHPVNQAREARGDLPVNGVWLWGGGQGGGCSKHPFVAACGDSLLAEAFALVSAIPWSVLPDDAGKWMEGKEGDQLFVWEGLRRAIQHGDLHAWRESLQRFELSCAKPLLEELRAGRIGKITLDVLQARASRRFVLTRHSSWRFWHLSKRLADYSFV